MSLKVKLSQHISCMLPLSCCLLIPAFIFSLVRILCVQEKLLEKWENLKTFISFQAENAELPLKLIKSFMLAKKKKNRQNVSLKISGVDFFGFFPSFINMLYLQEKMCVQISGKLETQTKLKGQQNFCSSAFFFYWKKFVLNEAWYSK